MKQDFGLIQNTDCLFGIKSPLTNEGPPNKLFIYKNSTTVGAPSCVIIFIL